MRQVGWWLGALLLIGCARTEIEFVEVTHASPSWLLQPPLNSNDRLYGVGEGSSAHLSEQAALAHLAERLTVSIQSEHTSEIRSISRGIEFTQREVVRNLSSQSLGLAFQNYQVDAQQQTGPRTVATLVSVDTEQLMESLQETLSPWLMLPDSRITSIREWSQARHVLLQIENLRPYAALLRTLGSGSEAQRLDLAESVWSAEIERFAESHSIRMDGDVGCQPFLPLIAQTLLSTGLILEEEGTALTLECRSDFRQQSAYGLHIGRVTLSLEIWNSERQLEHSIIRTVKASSSAASAQSQLHRAFQAQLSDIGPVEWLGLDPE